MELTRTTIRFCSIWTCRMKDLLSTQRLQVQIRIRLKWYHLLSRKRARGLKARLREERLLSPRPKEDQDQILRHMKIFCLNFLNSLKQVNGKEHSKQTINRAKFGPIEYNIQPSTMHFNVYFRDTTARVLFFLSKYLSMSIKERYTVNFLVRNFEKNYLRTKLSKQLFST